MKRNILFLIVGMIIATSICVGASILYIARDIEYTSTKTSETNVQDAIEELYTKYLSYGDIKYNEIYYSHWYSDSFTVLINDAGTFVTGGFDLEQAKYLTAKNVGVNRWALVAKKKCHVIGKTAPGTSITNNVTVDGVFEAGDTVFESYAGWNVILTVDEEF